MKQNIQYIQTPQNTRIAYINRMAKASHSDKPTIVYLGGFCSNMFGTKASLLDEWAAENGMGYVRFDYRGHGSSGGDFLDFGLSDWVDDAELILRDVVNGPAILVGSSMGGWVACALALRLCPEKISGLVGIAAAPDFTEDHFWADFDAEQRRVIDDGGVVELPSGYSEPYRISANLIKRSRAALVMWKPLMMGFPVRLLQGAQDKSVSLETAMALFCHIQSDDLRILVEKSADHGFSRLKDMQIIFETISELA